MPPLSTSRSLLGRVGSTPGSTIAGGATLPGSATQYSSAYGGIPGAANPLVTASQALSGNLANLSQLYQLASGVIPGLTQAESVVGQGLQGQVPNDVVGQLIQRAAERGVAGGFTGPNVNASYLKDLGLTSLGIQNNAFNQALQLGNLKYGIFGPQLVSAESQQAAQQAANVYASLPNPADAAAAAIKAARSGTSTGSGTSWASAGTPRGGTVIIPPSSAPSSPWSVTSENGPGMIVGRALGPFTETSRDPYAAWASWWGAPTMAETMYGNSRGVTIDPNYASYWDPAANTYDWSSLLGYTPWAPPAGEPNPYE